jgi:phosphoribosyl 1,2-cyclic phosphodiesterase
MSLRFSVLASGSSGNAALVETNGFGVLIDAGLGPRLLSARLAAVDRSWRHIHAVMLTHTHSDHWSDRTLAHLRRLGIPFYCHADHHVSLRQASAGFSELRSARLVREYQPGQCVTLSSSLACTPLPLWHDETTCGFRFEGPSDLFGQPSTLGYAADLGSWQSSLVEALVDADILALEFNHDVIMERTSRRSPALIFRVLGDRGHLSNTQAADLLREVLKHSQPGRLQHLVQLHLSRQCNRPPMATDAARVVLEEMGAEVAIHTATQNAAGPSLTLGEHVRGGKKGLRSRQPETIAAAPRHVQQLLPGWDAV